MQKELIFTSEPIFNKVGYNQKVKILAIQDKTWQHRYYDSMSDCSKSIGANVREISKISLGKLYTCSKGWTFIRCNDKTDLWDEIKLFKQKRESYNIEIIPKTRICYKCKKEKLLNSDNFHKGKSQSKYAKVKFKSICKECRKGEHTDGYKRRKDIILNDIDLQSKELLKIYKRIDKLKKIFFDLSEKWINENIIGKSCFYCGFTEDIGIDRINNNIGHIPSNCIPCCKICNITRMNNFTHEEFKKIGLVIKQIKLERNGIKTEHQINAT